MINVYGMSVPYLAPVAGITRNVKWKPINLSAITNMIINDKPITYEKDIFTSVAFLVNIDDKLQTRSNTR